MKQNVTPTDAVRNLRETPSGGRRYQQAITRLREVGLRATRQRIALTRLIMVWDHQHFSAETLYNEAKGANIRVSLATVYNTLHLFTDAGLLRHVILDPNKSYYDTNTDHHHHFYCEETAEIWDIPYDQVAVKAPSPPPGTEVASLDVTIRLHRSR